MAVITAAVLLGSALFTAMLNTRSVSAVEDKQEATQATAPAAVTEIPEMTAATGEEYEVTAWWKADLSDYRENLSLVSYETVEVPTEEPTEEQPEGVVINDTGISYIEPDSGYQAIQIVPEAGSAPVQRPESDPVDVAPGNFAFTTYGYGHGVGMSQNGANHYASYSGWNYQQILQHYYPGTYIQNTGKTDATISAGGVSGSVLDIVSMVTYNEVGGSMANEAIKAQAVAVYTYIMYKGGSAGDLYPKSNPPQNVIDAVKSVLGEAIYYDGSYALAMFCASSGGSTASCYDIFYQDIPYLRSVYCEYDSQCDPHYGTVEVISADEVRADLESALGITLSDDPSNWISVIEGDGGYAAYVVVDGQVTIKGNDFRVYLGLKSPNFGYVYY
jgi:hypothetical protein